MQSIGNPAAFRLHHHPYVPRIKSCLVCSFLSQHDVSYKRTIVIRRMIQVDVTRRVPPCCIAFRPNAYLWRFVALLTGRAIQATSRINFGKARHRDGSWKCFALPFIRIGNIIVYFLSASSHRCTLVFPRFGKLIFTGKLVSTYESR